MLRLPPEILGQIFLLCPHETITLSPSETPWTLSRVSRYWREIAINTPGLWTSICIDVYNAENLRPRTHRTGEYKAINSPTMLSSALEWSAGLPLHVVILDPGEPVDTFRCLFDILMPTSIRWKSLSLYCTLNDLAGGNFLSRYGILTFPALEKLKDSSFPASFLAIQRHAPQLNALILPEDDELFAFWKSGDSSLWIRLTYLELASSHQQSILAVLQQCNQLETLIVHECAFEDEVPEDMAPIEVRSLRKLQMPVMEDLEDTAWYLATYLILPNLTYLAIHYINIWDTLDPIMKMVQRSGCTLQTVEFESTSPKDVTVGRLLRMAPQLSRLIIRGPIFSWLFDQMASDSGSPFVPNLEHLSVLFGGITAGPRGYHSRPLGAILKAAKSLPQLQTLHVESFAEESGVDWISALEDRDVSTCIVKKDNVDRVRQLANLSGYLSFVHRRPVPYDDVFYENAPVFEEIFRILENDTNLTKKEFQSSGLEERMKEISLKSFAEGFQFDSRAERLLARWNLTPV